MLCGAAYRIRCLGGIVFEEDARGTPLSRFGLHAASASAMHTTSRPIIEEYLGFRPIGWIANVNRPRITVVQPACFVAARFVTICDSPRAAPGIHSDIEVTHMKILTDLGPNLEIRSLTEYPAARFEGIYQTSLGGNVSPVGTASGSFTSQIWVITSLPSKVGFAP